RRRGAGGGDRSRTSDEDRTKEVPPGHHDVLSLHGTFLLFLCSTADFAGAVANVTWTARFASNLSVLLSPDSLEGIGREWSAHNRRDVDQNLLATHHADDDRRDGREAQDEANRRFG